MSDIHKSEPSDQESSELEVPQLAGFHDCRVKRAFADYFDCLGSQAAACGHSLRFANGYLCRHPKVAEIFTRTESSKHD